MRRKSKPIPKATHNDDKKVAEVAKKAGLQEIPGLDEANIIMNDGSVVQIANPKVRGALQANSFVIHGSPAQKSVSQLAPNMRGDSLGMNSAMNDLAMNPVIQSATAKLQAAFTAAGLSQEDLQNPSKQGEVQAAIDNAVLSPEERQSINVLMSMGSGAAPGGESEEDIPE